MSNRSADRSADRRSLFERVVEFIAPGPDSRDELIESLAQAESRELIGPESRAMLEGVLRQQEQKAQQWAFPPQEVSTVNVRELCREPFDSAGLEEVLCRIRQRCEEELGNDRKVLLQ